MSNQRIQTAAEQILNASPVTPSLAIVLGSGFQVFLDSVDSIAEIPYRDLPGFPKLHVPGHQARILIGKLEDVPVYVLSGRAHYYEGHTMDAVTFPVRVLAECSVRAILLTNAAGGIHQRFRPGDLMAISDHMNFMGVNPLRGGLTRHGPSFVDLTETYDATLLQMLHKAARRSRTRLRTGVYMAVSGPSFETPAEIRAFAKLGADAVGMSTVPEAIVARQCGLKVSALSCITNYAAGRNPTPITHEEVLATGKNVGKKVGLLLSEFVREWGRTAENSKIQIPDPRKLQNPNLIRCKDQSR